MPKVETFEHNIVEEIKRKDASLTEISAASNNVGNDPVILPKQKPIFLIVLGVLFIVFLGALIGIWYFYFTDSLLPPSQGEQQLSTNSVPKVPADLKTLSPALAQEIGRFVKSVEKKDRGYVLTITEYAPVFAYITRNETSYIEELANLFAPLPGNTATSTTETKATTPATTTLATSTLQKATTTIATSTTATSTKKTSVKTTAKVTTKSATTTAASTTPVIETKSPELPVTAIEATLVTASSSQFKDVTLSNQNMRVWTNGKRRVVYAFVGNTTILIGDSPESILALKSGILR